MGASEGDIQKLALMCVVTLFSLNLLKVSLSPSLSLSPSPPRPPFCFLVLIFSITFPCVFLWVSIYVYIVLAIYPCRSSRRSRTCIHRPRQRRNRSEGQKWGWRGMSTNPTNQGSPGSSLISQRVATFPLLVNSKLTTRGAALLGISSARLLT